MTDPFARAAQVRANRDDGAADLVERVARAITSAQRGDDWNCNDPDRMVSVWSSGEPKLGEDGRPHMEVSIIGEEPCWRRHIADATALITFGQMIGRLTGESAGDLSAAQIRQIVDVVKFARPSEFAQALSSGEID